MKPPHASPARREFILAGAIGVAATAAVPMRQMRSGDRVRGDESAGNPGYRLTEHIRRYYRTTRI
jgi:hypothetical protein